MAGYFPDTPRLIQYKSQSYVRCLKTDTRILQNDLALNPVFLADLQKNRHSSSDKVNEVLTTCTIAFLKSQTKHSALSGLGKIKQLLYHAEM